MLIVTGGAGFIGSVLVAELERRALGPIIVSDRLGVDGKWKNIAKRELFDLVLPQGLGSTLARHRAQIRGVFHLGAISETTATDGDAVVENNIRLSFDLWDWCAANRVPFVYASSAATYGDGKRGFRDDDTAEGLAALRPLNLYGWSKHVVDRKFVALARAGEPAPPLWAGFKLFNVYGPNEYHKGPMRSVVVQVYEQIIRGGPARLFKSDRPDYADGGQMRDFVWVGDAVDAMVWQLEHGRQSGIYNLGTGAARSFKDLVQAVFTSLGRPAEIEYIEMPPHLKGRYQYFTEAPMERFRAAGWGSNSTSLEDGVDRYIRQYLATADPYC